MINKDKIIQTFTNNIQHLLAELVPSEKRRLVSLAVEIEKIDFAELAGALSESETDYLCWSQPESEFSFLGIGSLFTATADGNSRTTITEQKIEELREGFINNWNDFNLSGVPLILGGMKFSANYQSELWEDYHDSDWFIPNFLLLSFSGKTYLIYNFFPDNSGAQLILDKLDAFLNDLNVPKEKNDNPHDFSIVFSNEDDETEKNEWIEKVNRTLDEIRKGIFTKIVLSRSVSLKFDGAPGLSILLSELSKKYPRCFIFAFHKNNSTFFGASPERLAKLHDGIIEADALAGSLPRGETPEEDRRLEEELLNSEKNLAEQNVVVEFIAESFSDFTSDIEYNEKPVIRKLPNIQHLWTPIKAKLTEGQNVFSILKTIHPTPAICGSPWTVALDSIIKTENYDRGLFAGIVGWFNFNNEGEFAVSIRSAIIKGAELRAFAGCGIVEGSDPILEYEETKLKLKPILSLFKYEVANKS